MANIIIGVVIVIIIIVTDDITMDMCITIVNSFNISNIRDLNTQLHACS